MRRWIFIGLAAMAAAGSVGYFHYEPSAGGGDQETFAFVERYCTDCHNASEQAGGVAFDTLVGEPLHAHAQVWEAAIRKLRGRQMPPPGERRPDEARIDTLVVRIEDSLDAAAEAEPNPGATVLHRLNRAEYANAIRDLLDLPFDASALLPADDSSEGFDNIASALSVSPAHMQAYVTAAAKISRLAVGDATASPEIVTYRPPPGLDQSGHLEGLPLGTRGGLLVRHVFPLDAEYELSVGRGGAGFGLAAVGADEEAEITMDGERVQLLGRGAPRSFKMRIPAGPHELGVAIVQRSAPRGVNDLYAELASSAGVQSLVITGPFDPAGPGDTPSRRRLFVCMPETAADEAPCARRILESLASRAFRRPVDDATLDVLTTFFEDGRALRGFETGIQYALARVLVDPRFIYRFEREPADLPAGSVFALDDFEVATRLSFFLWSSIPDDALLETALAGRLRESDVLRGEVRRMLAHRKSDALVEHFAGQWLMLRQLDSVSPAAKEFDGNLRFSMKRETLLLFESILREDRSILDLLDADYTFVDERLARHYDIPNVRGSRFRRIMLAEDDPRRGLLGHGSFLTLTSAPNRTSPVKRGAWVLENLLGTPAPPPPAGVETNLEETAGAAPTSLRGRLELHRGDPSCASCHRIMDGIGFALENFDSIGGWREVDGAEPIDARGALIDGTSIDGPAELRRALLSQQELLVTRFAEKLLTYALGRRVEHYDMPAVRGIVRVAAEENYRVSAFVVAVAESLPFSMKRKAAEDVAETSAAARADDAGSSAAASADGAALEERAQDLALLGR